MPKKTKKEKIIAQYRRKLLDVRQAVPTPRPFVYQATPIIAQPTDVAIRKDLIKTLLLAVLAIGGEVALSYIF